MDFEPSGLNFYKPLALSLDATNCALRIDASVAVDYVAPDGKRGRVWELWGMRANPDYNPSRPVSPTNARWMASWGPELSLRRRRLPRSLLPPHGDARASHSHQRQ